MLSLVTSDFHGNLEILDSLEKMIKENRFDVIFFCGDIVKGHKRGNEWLVAKKENRIPNREKLEIITEKDEDTMYYRKFYNFLDRTNIKVFTIPGNMDAPESLYLKTLWRLKKKNIHLVHETIHFLEDFNVCGFGGEINEDERENFFVLEYTRDETFFALRKLAYLKKDFVLLTHSPPVCDLAKGKGSPVVNEIIKKYKPKFLFCGHSHLQGKEKIDETIVVNPGALKKGDYAIVDLKTKEVKLKSL
jgi:Icc-related predicted phosphoesterase